MQWSLREVLDDMMYKDGESYSYPQIRVHKDMSDTISADITVEGEVVCSCADLLTGLPLCWQCTMFSILPTQTNWKVHYYFFKRVLLASSMIQQKCESIETVQYSFEPMNLYFLSYFSGNRQDQYKYFNLIVYIGPFVYHFQYIAYALLSH